MGALSSTQRLTIDITLLVESLEPTRSQWKRKWRLQELAQETLQQKWPSCTLHMYGSSANCFGWGDSDLDLCLLFPNVVGELLLPAQRVELLREAAALLRDRFEILQLVENATVPVLKIWDPQYKIPCDICIGNSLALHNTALLRLYAQIDPRVRPLGYAVKYWAQQRGMNSSSQGTLSSYALILMVIHFLQVRSDAILPCIRPFPLHLLDTLMPSKLALRSSYGGIENESVGNLLQELFYYYAYDFDYSRHMISIRAGQTLPKPGPAKRRLCIEDPYDVNHDVGRVIFSTHGQDLIEREFRRASELLKEGKAFSTICGPRENIHGCYICDEQEHTARCCPVSYKGKKADTCLKNTRDLRVRQMIFCCRCGMPGHQDTICPQEHWDDLRCFQVPVLRHPPKASTRGKQQRKPSRKTSYVR